MSYTLRGRIESRLAAFALPLLGAAAWSAVVWGSWPLAVAAVMVAVGLALDVGAYHRLLPYQPGWAALPLGALELALTMLLVRGLEIPAPPGQAIAFFAAAWLWAQVLGHAALPLAHLQYAEDGGELGRAGLPLAAAVTVVLALAGGAAWASRPPTVHLHGIVRGPLVLDEPQTVVGGVVRGGIVVTADHVTVRDTVVVGGDNAIEIDDAHHVMLDGVRVSGFSEDGIHARKSSVMVSDCAIAAPPGTQGIDISFAMHDGMSMVEDCVVSGGDVGVTMHTVMGDIAHNTVTGAAHHGIELTEMSMGAVSRNTVVDARDVGIYCGDHSECEIHDNTLVGGGRGILTFYYAHSRRHGNTAVR